MLHSNWTTHRHITHLQLGNTLVRFPDNVGLGVGHQRCLLHLTGHLEAQICHRVIVASGASRKSDTKPLKTVNKQSDLLLNVSSHKCYGKYRTEHGPELFSHMRMMEHKQIHWTLTACVVCCEMCDKYVSTAVVWGIACSTKADFSVGRNKTM
jgi:hypothetical protein